MPSGRSRLRSTLATLDRPRAAVWALIEGKQSFKWTMTRRSALVRFFALHALLSLSLLMQELLSGRDEANSELCLGIRAGGTAANLGLLLLVRQTWLPARPAHFASLLLLCVLATIANAVWRLRSAAQRTNELHELSLLQLSAYALLVPTFSVRSVALLTAGLSLFEPLVLLPRASSAALDLLLRELVKAVCLNAVGIGVAVAAEQQHAANHSLVQQFATEAKRFYSAQRDTQRLLMATLPEPVVREIATKGGRAKCAHRYDGVTVLQASLPSLILPWRLLRSPSHPTLAPSRGVAASPCSRRIWWASRNSPPQWRYVHIDVRMDVYMDECSHGWMFTWMDVHVNGGPSSALERAASVLPSAAGAHHPAAHSLLARALLARAGA